MNSPAQARRTLHLLVLGAALLIVGAALLQFLRPQPLLILEHPVEIREALLSPDGLTLVSTRYEQRDFSGPGDRFESPVGFAWNTQTGALMGRFGHTNPLYSMTLLGFSVDGRYLLTNESRLNVGLQVWDTQSWEVVYEDSGCVNCMLDFSPSGRYLAATFNGEDADLRVYYVDRGRDERIELPPLRGGPDAGLNMPRFSPDEKLLALGNSLSPDSAEISIWDLVTGLRWHQFDQPSALKALHWSPDGRYLLAEGQDGHLRTWDTRDGQRLQATTQVAESQAAYNIGINGGQVLLFHNEDA